jgi:hypothetical protein
VALAIRCQRHEHAPDRIRESRDAVHRRLAVERDDDVEALAAGGLDPRRQPQFVQQIAQSEGGGAHRRGVLLRRIEIEDADIRVVQTGYARDPDMLRDGVLVGDPHQRPLVRDHRVMQEAVFLRHLDALQPVGNPLRDVFLPETLLADAGRIALHRDRPALDVRQDRRRHRLVVRREVTFRDPIVREHDLFGVGDHDSLTTW